MDLGGGPGHVLDVVALEDELVLGALVLGNSNSVEHLHDPHPLLTQEVSDLDGLSRVLDGDVDREMGVHKPHGVPETPSDSEDHVVDVGDNRPGSREPLARSVPDLDLHVWLAIDLGLEQVDLQVAQVPRQGSSWSLDGDDLGLDVALDISRDLQLPRVVHLPHGCGL
eukprot:CAMPEP_0198462790 /NCGR_PEP_ID=MMETSP1456-20131121/1233_1 /TAXON_ID=1461544 ORGANISM="Unidentified sp., Strain RCC1871" /NCGR_SAMPLE_ID=MMETSP1456 /ASSEMBLY_ACC=CAM_ASM_001119 /LENGTH=167 /DNA_ID=CAMNT_0044188069 /DNA_START=158 /DNA_END=661 /DNA_ORIENTATION=-